MKLSTDKCKIVGVALGEAEINLLFTGKPIISAKFGLSTEHGPIGHMTRTVWSEKTQTALQAFVAALEEEALEDVFEVPVKTEENGSPNEPPQF